MTPMSQSWKSPLVLFVAVLALYLASLKIGVHRSAEAKPQAPISAPSTDPADANDTPNDIPELQQLG
jgi:hypothetical protein